MGCMASALPSGRPGPRGRAQATPSNQRAQARQRASNRTPGLAVFAGVLVSYKSGGHLNAAVTLGIVASGAKEFVPGIPVDAASISVYLVAQLIAAFIGAVLAWAAYKKQYNAAENQGAILASFSTGPEIRSYGWNLVTEVLGTFVLVFVVLAAGHWGDSATKTPVGLGWLGALGVALLVVSIGASLGGPTGYAINPGRDIMPRLAHAILPIPGKGPSDWSYSWVSGRRAARRRRPGRPSGGTAPALIPLTLPI